MGKKYKKERKILSDPFCGVERFEILAKTVDNKKRRVTYWKIDGNMTHPYWKRLEYRKDYKKMYQRNISSYKELEYWIIKDVKNEAKIR